MAIYHLSIKPISRSKGRSAVSAAAYRSGEKLYDERREKNCYYRGKSAGVLYSEILIPDNAPTWMKDRGKLWNAAEAAEKRKDSRVAKEVELALPKELSISENIELLKEYIDENFVKEGIVADVNIHDQDLGNQNIHAHVMLTTRCATSDGLSDKKALFLDKNESLYKWRDSWANVVNKHLALNGHNIQIDHRSYQEQGIELEPQNKRGPKFTRKKLIEKTEEHREIARQNGERIYQDPKIALYALSTQHSTFTKQDIARFVNRHTDSPEQFSRVFAKVYNSPDLVVLGVDQKGNERYSHKEMVELEKAMFETAKILSENYTHDVSNPEHDRISMKVSRIGRDIKEIFVEGKCFDYGSLSEEQQIAVRHITKGNDLAFVLGYAGTGKSYMLGAAREIWEREGYRVRGISLTGVAARGLEEGSGIRSQTIASQFRSWEGAQEVLTKRDVVVLDEIGMVGSRVLERILCYVKEVGAKLVGVGDFSQLPSMEAGGARVVVERVGYVELTEVIRQIELWQQEATRQLARGEITEAIDSYHKRGYVHNEKQGLGIEQQLLDKWSKNLIEFPDKSQIMIAYTNAEVGRLNLQARDIMGELGMLSGEDQEVVASVGKLNIAKHEKILFLKNNYTLGVMNGMLGEVTAIDQSELSVVINKKRDNQREITFNIERYNHFTYGYAATIHKLQGATFDDTQVLVSKYFNSNLANVALTRHRQEMNIYHPCSDEEELARLLSRDGSKDTTLDYPYINQEIVNYGEIQELGDLGYMAFHHRELIKELELSGGKAVSFMTFKQERGLIAGIVEHHDKRYVVLEQAKEFKLYNEKFFASEEKELIDSVGCFVTITKEWDASQRGFNAGVSNTGLSLLPNESHEAKERAMFVLGEGVEALHNKITTLEERYHKPINFSVIGEDTYGIYRGSTNICEKEYGILETTSNIRMLESLIGIGNDSWVVVGDEVTPIDHQEVPTEQVFSEKRPDLRKEQYEIAKIKRHLIDSAERVVENLMGEPNIRLSSSTEWRYGNKGSLSISIAGERRGLWHNFETGESGDLIKLIQKETGQGFLEVLKYAASIGGGSYLILPRSIQSKTQSAHKETSKTSEYAQKLVAESKAIEGTIVERYLREVRGINNIEGADLRYHPQVFTSKQEVHQYLPAMLSVGRDNEGNVQCVQATYLNPETANKAELAVTKRTYASPSGALVHLQERGGVKDISYIAEGVETGLSIKDAGVGEVVVTLGKSNFINIDPQSIGEKAVFCLDNDGAIYQDITIHKAAERLTNLGKEVFIVMPEGKATGKVDFNDIARAEGVEAVRENIKHLTPYLGWKDLEKGLSNIEEIGAENRSNEEQIDKIVPYEAVKGPEGLSGELGRDVQEDKSIKLDVRVSTEPTELAHGVEQDGMGSSVDNKGSSVIEEIGAEKRSDEEQIDKIVPYEAVKGSEGLSGDLGRDTQEDKSIEPDVRVSTEPTELAHGVGQSGVGSSITNKSDEYLDTKDKHSSSTATHERMQKVYEEYNAMKQGYLDAQEAVDNVFKYGGAAEELIRQRQNRSEAKEAWDSYATSMCKEADVLRAISQADPDLFKEMNKSFDNIFGEAIKKDDLHNEYFKTIGQHSSGLSTNERVQKVYEQYSAKKQEYLEAQEAVDNVFKYRGSAEELIRQRENRSEAKQEFDNYCSEICKDKDFMGYLEMKDGNSFKEMNNRLNELVRGMAKDLQKEFDRFF